MESSMQDANEKMVPLDTSGDPVEVELNDEKEQVEVKEEPQKEKPVHEMSRQERSRRVVIILFLMGLTFWNTLNPFFLW